MPARDRRRAAARRVREIAAKLRTRAKLGREESTRVIARVIGELADLAETAAAEAAAVLRNGRRALPAALSGRMRGRLRRALDELAVTIGRTATIVAQARSRLAGQLPDSATRLVSLHDPDARPIRKGRIDRPVEFGYKAQVIDNDDGVTLDYGVQVGNSPDAPQLTPAISRITRRAQRAALSHRRPRVRRARDRTGAGSARGCVRSPSRAEPRSHPPAAPSSTAADSAPLSSGGPDPKAGSVTSSADMAGTPRGWTAAREPQSGADTGYSPTTWSRSALWPADSLPTQTCRCPSSALGLFQVEVARVAAHHAGQDRPRRGPADRR
jgi:hypothetical protein